MSNKQKNLDDIVIAARRQQDEREKGYRELALKMYPWICGRCQREFTRANLSELTVHHRNHDHDDNPPDGSNWELLCIYCHDNEHQRYINNAGHGSSPNTGGQSSDATHKPFADLDILLKHRK
ncbi:YajD family HNH nuclease [Kaarinaea lacus]